MPWELDAKEGGEWGQQSPLEMNVVAICSGRKVVFLPKGPLGAMPTLPWQVLQTLQGRLVSLCPCSSGLGACVTQAFAPH